MTGWDPRALAVLERLERAGFRAVLVGGCVRDRLLGLSSHDYDVAASALPEQVEAACADLPCVETGIRHGTVTVLSGGLPVEVTTFRREGGYSDHRRPDRVEFTQSLEEDLARRDFTVNAVAWERNGRVTDPFGGRADLEQRLVRCVGEPDRRFEEDALRVLRGLRLAAQLGFSLHPDTAAALRRHIPQLSLVAWERIWAEFVRLLCSPGAGVTVKWNAVRDHMHVDSGWRPAGEAAAEEAAPARPALGYAAHAALEQELLAIFERTYGPVKPRAFRPAPKAAPRKEKPWKGLKKPEGEDWLLVDGYNIIHAWPQLRELARADLEGARQQLVHRLRNYQGWKRCRVIVVFDAYQVKGGAGSVERHGDVWVVYTKEAETADMYIEKTTYKLGRRHRVRVATSDGLEQLIILGHGARRMSAGELEQEILQTEADIRRTIQN